MIKWLFEQNYIQKSTHKDDLYFIGHLWYKGVYYEANIDSIVESFENIEEFERAICQFNGNFLLVFNLNGKTIIAIDRIMSFPALYVKKDDDIYLSNSIGIIRKELKINSLDENAAKEFLSSGFTLGNQTVFEGVKAVLPGHYLVIDQDTNMIQDKVYFEHIHDSFFESDREKLSALLDETINNVFGRLVKELNGRQVALFLSGGYDSRLVAVNLKKFNYTNVVCLSFRTRLGKEEQVAKEIADDLGYKWILLDSYKIYRQVNAEQGYDSFLQESGAGMAYPYEQGVLVKPFLEDGILEKDCVVITGNSGDVVEGADFSNLLINGEQYTKEQVVEIIDKEHCCKYGIKFGHDSAILNIIRNFLPEKEVFTYEEAQDVFEKFNWINRQCKYVVNDIRCYDIYLGLDWRLPLWDNEFVDFWLKVPTEWRENRKLYYYYLKDENYDTANKKTKYDITREQLRKKAFWILKIAYPIRKIYEYVKNYKFVDYKVSFGQYLRIIIKTGGYRMNSGVTREIQFFEKFYKPLLPK